MQPKTLREVALEKLSDMLKDAGGARQQSIKLKGIDYAGNLADELLQFATSLENVYGELQQALKEEDGDKVTSILADIKLKEEAGAKAKARYSRHFCSPEIYRFVSSYRRLNAVTLFVSFFRDRIT